jgi:putative transposase
MPDWPHSPLHRLDSAGAYMVTAGTYRKALFFRSRSHLDLLQAHLFALAIQYEAALQAWAIFPNHYHFVAQSIDPGKITAFIRHLHSLSAREINRLDGVSTRKIWFQFWDSHLTFERSYFARLHYVHTNAVHHGLVRQASNYPWCSAAWFERTAAPAFRKTVFSFPLDQLSIPDSFELSPHDLDTQQ